MTDDARHVTGETVATAVTVCPCPTRKVLRRTTPKRQGLNRKLAEIATTKPFAPSATPTPRPFPTMLLTTLLLVTPKSSASSALTPPPIAPLATNPTNVTTATAKKASRWKFAVRTAATGD
ncbi:MAG: hypothetical protein PVTTEEND_000627 [Candidatus Fervidibacter sp.]